MTFKTTDLLNELDQSVQEIIHTIDHDFATLSSRELNWKPLPEKWSIAECLEHLNIYSRYYNPAMEHAIAEGKKYPATDGFKSSWFGNFSVKSVHPDNMKLQKTLKRLDPAQSRVSDNVVEEFLMHQKKLQKILSESRTLNLNRIKIPAEVAKFMKLRLGDCLRFVIAHEQRHIRQAKNVLEGLSPLIA